MEPLNGPHLVYHSRARSVCSNSTILSSWPSALPSSLLRQSSLKPMEKFFQEKTSPKKPNPNQTPPPPLRISLLVSRLPPEAGPVGPWSTRRSGLLSLFRRPKSCPLLLQTRRESIQELTRFFLRLPLILPFGQVSFSFFHVVLPNVSNNPVIKSSPPLLLKPFPRYPKALLFPSFFFPPTHSLLFLQNNFYTSSSFCMILGPSSMRYPVSPNSCLNNEFRRNLASIRRKTSPFLRTSMKAPLLPYVLTPLVVFFLPLKNVSALTRRSTLSSIAP